VRASPLARRIAYERGIDLARVTGTGPHGRVLREDVERATLVAAPAAPAARPDRTVKLAPMRKVIARRLTESHQQVPVYHLTSTFEVDSWPTLKAALTGVRPDLRISYNDLLVAAVSRALVLHPRVNASWTEAGIVEHGRVDVGVAVALPDGLVTPVIRGADALGLAAIAERTRALVAKAREGRLVPEDYQGGTFTVSNLGSFGIEQFTAVINPPEAAILAVGAVRQVPVVTDGRAGVGWRMSVTLSCDHRVIDGAVGAAFLRTLGQFVVAPGLLAV
jgi:pyruvate dehydrogenase E2 component (dihydrolipoamide acetyltransferase)